MKNLDLAVFFVATRGNRQSPGVMGPVLDGNEVAGAEAIITWLSGLPVAWVAYALATAWHETAHTMQPVKEYGSKARAIRLYDISGNRPKLAKSMGNTSIGDGALYVGRGLVQLTWKDNYEKAGEKIGYPLVGNPELACRPDIAAQIMRYGMVEGWFTTKKFADYLPADKPANHNQFKQARKIINGTDDDGLIADYAVQFQAALQAGGYHA